MIAGDPQGNVMAAWTQSLSGGFTILAKRFTPSGGWEATEHIGTDMGSGVGRWVAMDAQGNALVVWDESFVANDIWANRFTPSGGWGVPERIEANDGSVGVPFVTMQPNGNAIATWYQRISGTYRVVVNQFAPSGGWSTPRVIDGGGGAYGGPNPPQVGMDAQGNAVAVWNKDNNVPLDPRSNIWANRFD